MDDEVLRGGNYPHRGLKQISDKEIAKLEEAFAEETIPIGD